MTTDAKKQVDALTQAGFKPAESEARKRIIVSIEGEEKTGKNNWAFTAPDPIAVFSFDQGIEGVVEKFVNGSAIVGGIPIPRKVIYVKDMKLPVMAAGKGPVQLANPNFNYEAAWVAFLKAYRAVLAAKVRTVIWDTATEVLELLRLLRFGQLSQVGHLHGPVNTEYRGLIREAYEGYSNLILLHKMKPLYVDDKRTGRMERAGLTDIGYVIQVNLKTFRADREDGGSDFSVKVLDCRQNAQINGAVYEGMECTFPFLAADVIEGTERDDWE